MRRLISFCLAMAMVLGTMALLVPHAQAAEVASGKCGNNVSWSLDDKGTLLISGTGNMHDYNGQDHFAPWYNQRDSINSVVIEPGVTSIGRLAFSHCTNMRSIAIPDTVTEIGSEAFWYCNSLVSVVLPDSVTSIGSYAFDICPNLTSIVLPKNLTVISEGMFISCTSLKSITIPSSVTHIELYAFWSCDNLTSIYFTGDAPEFIHGAAFLYDTATAYYPANNSTWTSSIMQNYGGKLTWVPYEITRLAGDTRFETSFKIADELKEIWDVDKFSTVIIASGTNFADALSGTYLANVKCAPILLSCNKEFNPKYVEKYNNMLVQYIRSNLSSGGTVYILGGEKAVDPSLDALLSEYRVVRLAGATRYETNIAILKEAGVKNQEILICYGEKFPDSLAASATGRPIMLVNNKLSDTQKNFLNTTSGNLIIIGGTSVVSAAMERTLSSYGSVERIAGANRYHTCSAVVQRFFDKSDDVVIAYGETFPDGLCGGVLAYAMDAPLILMSTNTNQTAALIKTMGSTSGIVLGGTGLISDDSVRAIFAMD